MVGAALLLPTALGLQPASARPLRVGISGNAPFLIRRGDVLEGITPDLWRVVAEENSFQAELVPKANTAANLKALERGELDLAIGPISITPERLSSGAIEFTQPYFFGQVGVLVPLRDGGLWARVKPFFQVAALSSIGLLLLSLFVVGNLIWLAERRRNPEHFPPHYLHGVGNGLWFAIVTLTTVGYGDRAPVTRLGRVIAAVWMMITLLAVSSITAGLASAFTVSLARVPGGGIQSVEGLRNRPVAVVKGTTSEKWGRLSGASLSQQPTLQAAVAKLAAGKVDAVIYDSPALRYYLSQNPRLDLKLAPFSLAQETYGFAMPLNSPLEKPLDVSLLRMLRSGQIEAFYQGWVDGPTDDAAPGRGVG
ncbi:transporter substrate-binding domain-containing protein [Cyanobium sp. LEGE 06113]|uniref:transporter substrate-binding domain-containing protein n=1 Tax=Cyanobium sp. LEGE 06113 TaxID=1297573 RepID=UPI00187FD208|nr:transporter substrate-binding domain-containing protein [Cyanobium sp. LEGE 06113]MBE9153462.1 transporter substrate-binding domain-containing protein [Cyanobium sp. LEGE 06113]